MSHLEISTLSECGLMSCVIVGGGSNGTEVFICGAFEELEEARVAAEGAEPLGSYPVGVCQGVTGDTFCGDSTVCVYICLSVSSLI